MIISYEKDIAVWGIAPLRRDGTTGSTVISNGTAAPVVHSTLHSPHSPLLTSSGDSLIHRPPAHPESAASLLPRIRCHRLPCAPVRLCLCRPPLTLPFPHTGSHQAVAVSAGDAARALEANDFRSAGSLPSRDRYGRAGSGRVGGGEGGAGDVCVRSHSRLLMCGAALAGVLGVGTAMVARSVLLRLREKPPTSLFFS